MTRTEPLYLAVALAMSLGCKGLAPAQAPRPTAAEPAQGFAASEATIVIVGTAFHVRAVHHAGERGSSVDASYRAWLGTHELLDVVWLDTGRLRARVPAGLPIGLHDLSVEGPYGSGSVAGAYEVFPGASPSLTASVALPAAANVGQDVALVLTVENGGDWLVEGVRLQLTASGPGAVELIEPAAVQDIPPGERRILATRLHASAAGAVSLAITAAGSDPRTGAVVEARTAASVRVERPAALSATLTLPSSAAALQDIVVVTMTVTNTGEATAADVFPGSFGATPSSTAGVSVLDGPSQPVVLVGGATAAFTWTCRAVAAGSLVLGATAMGVDVNDGGGRTANASSEPASVPYTAPTLMANPFGDGSPFAFVAPLGGQVYVGPNRSGTGLVRVQRDGTSPESLAVSFWRDTTASNTMSNTASPYASIGSYGCQPDSFTEPCGPDDEDGRGLLTSVSFAGEEWLVLGGAKASGDLDYVYLSRASSSPLAFSYVDLSLLLGGNTRGFSAAFAYGDRLYLGFPDNGGNRPYGIALLTPPPTSGGLDAIAGTQAFDLNLHDAYAASGATFASVSMVDAIAELGGRVYFFSDVGCLVSTGSFPAAKDDLVDCSPSPGAAYDRKSSVEPTRQHDLEPSERAWPQVVAWQGRLYAIRNTFSGPQLWSCDPATGADPARCEAGDWTLLAADGSLRSRLGQPDATAASMLLATPTHLYVGLDDPVRGIHVFRTRAVSPGLSDFTGRDGCVAGTAGCEGLGGDGMGAPGALTRIFDAKVITGADGRVDLFLTAGDGQVPVTLVRMDP